MSYKISKENDKKANEVIVDVVVSKEDFEKEIKKIYNQNKRYFSIPGFRKGKAPFNMVVNFYGKEMFYEDASKSVMELELKNIFEDEKFIKESNILTTVMPNAEITKMDEDGIGAKITFAKPAEVKLGKYKKIKVEVEENKVSAKDVEKRIEEEASKNARIETKKGKAKEGDTVKIDFKGYTGDKEYFEGGEAKEFDLELGSNSFIPGFEEQLVGVKAGDELEVKVTFPKEYHAENLAGQDAVFEVKVHEVKETVLPKIDDEFAKDLGHDSLKEYKEVVKDELKHELEHKKEHMVSDEVSKKLVEDSEVKVSDIEIESGVNAELNNMAQQYQMYGIAFEQMLQMTGQTIDDMKAQIRPRVEDSIKLRYILEEIAKEEKIEVEEKEIDEYLEEIAKSYREKVEVEDLKKQDNIEETAKINIATRKAFEYVTKNADVKEVKAKEEKEAKKDKKETKKEDKKDKE